MLESVKIQRRQSEIRQALAGLVGKEKPTDDETRSMETMDAEYRGNETRYRAALIAEDTERRDAKGELETRDEKQFAELIGKFEMRQVALALDEGRKLDGATAEIVQEMRSKGGYQGIPVPWAALEQRAGETVASGVFDPKVTRPVIDRIMPDSVAAKMGAQMVNIDSGLIEWPVVTSSVAAGWAATETGNVTGPTVFATTDKAMTPANTFGITMHITRKSMKQSGDALEQAIRRDMQAAIAAGLDAATFLGTGADGQPLGVITGYSTYGITQTDVSADVTWDVIRAAVTRFITNNAAPGADVVNLMLRPEHYNFLDGYLYTSTAVSHFDKVKANVGNVVMSSAALAAPAGGPPTEAKALMTVTKDGIAPFFIGTWGGVDLIRDVYTGAASGALKLTALVTADVTVARGKQLEILDGLQTVGPA
ncbi:MAG: phage major capsid protein [Pseudorhodoplanes sp.]|nr:phage major capsid protein [Pseudorhodoplanes sp.]